MAVSVIRCYELFSHKESCPQRSEVTEVSIAIRFHFFSLSFYFPCCTLGVSFSELVIFSSDVTVLVSVVTAVTHPMSFRYFNTNSTFFTVEILLCSSQYKQALYPAEITSKRKKLQI